MNHEKHERHEKERHMSLVYPDESYAIMGACFEVYKDKGVGFVEPVYQECLEIELDAQQIPYKAQVQLPITYKGRSLKSRFIADVICYDKIIVELKAVALLIDEHRAQVHNYLRATGFKLGILVNFCHFPKLDYERIVL